MIVQVHEFDEVSAPGTNEPWNLVVMRITSSSHTETTTTTTDHPPGASTTKRARRRCRRARSGRAIRGQLALTAPRAPNQ
ncbi:MAG: hypothetical protein QOI92_2951 [Chloroflexota bacterium]|jgi:hypothetical protein|nr:hypothetical protein [Chloroflexota bacterium]